ncbi:unnamed protein product [Caenorhabditis angaria]|uniref:THAP-type domain-containing protein n=1 Tax=Caenorhabditis angaria TaxID=860376 RepID=A0A9P1I9W9_9PELO|nr:unnamed protein product [Caenorhabditis angaria]
MNVFNQSYFESILQKELPRQVYSCSYCKKKTYDLKEVTRIRNVNSGRELLQKWADILGENFQKNIRGLKSIAICRSHFKKTWNRHRPPNLLPVADLGNTIPEENITKSEFIRPRIKTNSSENCAYCGETKQFLQMTTVPTHEFYFNKWVAILGEEFRKNVENRGEKASAICRTHFDVQFLSRPQALLPKPMELREKKAARVKKIENKPNMLECCYCSEIRQNLTEMVETPKLTKCLLRWADVLGPTFYENFMKRKNRYICVEHLKRGSKMIFNDDIMEGFRRREKEKGFIANVVKEEEMEMDLKPDCEIEKILIEKDIKIEVEEVELREIKMEILE